MEAGAEAVLLAGMNRGGSRRLEMKVVVVKIIATVGVGKRTVKESVCMVVRVDSGELGLR